MEIEQSLRLEKSQIISMLKDRGIDVPKTATLHVSKTKDGELLIVKWLVKQPKSSS